MDNRRPGPIRDRSAGFTLMEMLVVLVIVGLMAALVGPRLASTLPRMQLKTSAKRVAAAFRYARSQAVAQKTLYMAVFRVEPSQLFIVPSTRSAVESTSVSADSILTEENLKQARSFTLPDGIGWIQTDPERPPDELNPIVFYPSGGTNGGEIGLTDADGNTYRLLVDFVTGTVEINEFKR